MGRLDTGRSESFRQYAADCVRLAEGEQQPEDKAIMLNLALAWIRLAQQSQEITTASQPGDDAHVPPPPAQAASGPALPAA